MAGTEQVPWAERRRYAIERHAQAERERRAVEVAKARRLVAEFTRNATELGLAVTSLVAGGIGGRGRFRTGLRGWYVHQNLLIGVSVDGGFYRLVVPGSLRTWLLGAVLVPQEPPLVVGPGARDGESVPLQALLRRRLEAADDWP